MTSDDPRGGPPTGPGSDGGTTSEPSRSASDSSPAQRPVRLLSEAIQERLDALQQSAKSGSDLRAKSLVTTGLPSADGAGLLRRGVLTVFAGHPGDGKSIVRQQLARAAALSGHRVQEYILEDPEDAAIDRVLARERLGAGGSPPAWAGNVVYDAQEYEMPRLFSTIHERWVGPEGDRGTDLVLLDYAQMFASSGGESAERTIALLAGRCAKMARVTGAAVVLFSQVRREVEDRALRAYEFAASAARRSGVRVGADSLRAFRPGANDLQWSSALNQRAKATVVVWREGRWARKVGLDWPDDTMDWYLAKGNFGPDVVSLRFRFDGATASITELPTQAQVGHEPTSDDLGPELPPLPDPFA